MTGDRTSEEIIRTYDEAHDLMMDDDWNGPFDTVCPECGIVALLWVDEDGEGVICATTGGCINSYDDPRCYT